jgi:hypothetical protein
MAIGHTGNPGPAHGQLLSPLTPYLALCGDESPVTLHIDFEHWRLLNRLERLRYPTPDPAGMAGVPDSSRESELEQLGRDVGEILAAIPTLGRELGRAAGQGSGLVHLRLLISGSELSLLPFELVISPVGYPGAGRPLLLQPQTPIIVTRQARRGVHEQPLRWNRSPRILFVSATPAELHVPAREHVQALHTKLASTRGHSAPSVVSLATCDAGNVGSVVAPGSSIAHELHLYNVPWVFASQFPLTKRGSVGFVRQLYDGLPWGEDPRRLLLHLRRTLHVQRRRDHDWGSLVAYASTPADLDREVQMFRSWQYQMAIDTDRDRADQFQHKAEAGRTEEEDKALRASLAAYRDALRAKSDNHWAAIEGRGGDYPGDRETLRAHRGSGRLGRLRRALHPAAVRALRAVVVEGAPRWRDCGKGGGKAHSSHGLKGGRIDASGCVPSCTITHLRDDPARTPMGYSPASTPSFSRRCSTSASPEVSSSSHRVIPVLVGSA